MPLRVCFEAAFDLCIHIEPSDVAQVQNKTREALRTAFGHT